MVASQAPLADRMRPQAIEDILGQDHLLGPDSALRRAMESGHIFSVILWGPPGSGKTTLARLMAQYTQNPFQSFSAVTSGVKELRQFIAEAEKARQLFGKPTILFVDEIHRFNKAQQDAFLPHIENGTIILIGATTENPSFEVISPLLSRCRVFVLRPLSEEDIARILRSALDDDRRGLGSRSIDADSDTLGYLAHLANGDARTALNALEMAVASFPGAAVPISLSPETSPPSMSPCSSPVCPPTSISS